MCHVLYMNVPRALYECATHGVPNILVSLCGYFSMLHQQTPNYRQSHGYSNCDARSGCNCKCYNVYVTSRCAKEIKLNVSDTAKQQRCPSRVPLLYHTCPTAPQNTRSNQALHYSMYRIATKLCATW